MYWLLIIKWLKITSSNTMQFNYLFYIRIVINVYKASKVVILSFSFSDNLSFQQVFILTTINQSYGYWCSKMQFRKAYFHNKMKSFKHFNEMAFKCLELLMISTWSTHINFKFRHVWIKFPYVKAIFLYILKRIRSFKNTKWQ